MMESQYTNSSDMFMDMAALDEKQLMKVHKVFYRYIADEAGDDYFIDRYVDDYELLENYLDDDRTVYLKITTNFFKSLVTFIDSSVEACIISISFFLIWKTEYRS